MENEKWQKQIAKIRQEFVKHNMQQEAAKAEKDKKELDEQNRINKETKKTL